MQKIKYIPLLALLYLLVSCSKEEKIYNDDPQIGFQDDFYEVQLPFQDTSEYVFTIPLKIFGSFPDNDQEVEYDLQLNNSQEKSQLIKQSTSVSISKDNYSPTLPLQCDPSVVDEGETELFKIQLQSGTDFKIAENYKTISVTLKKPVLTDLFTGSYLCKESLYNHQYMVELYKSELQENQLLIENFWNFSVTGQYIAINLNPTDNSITITEQEYVDKEDVLYRLSGSGLFSSDGSFTIEYQLYDINAGTVFETGTQTYIKQK